MNAKYTYAPIGSKVLVLPEKKTEEEKTKGGLYIPVTAKKDVQRGTVLAAGPGEYAKDTGVFIPNTVREGCLVLFGAEQGFPIQVEDEAGELVDAKVILEQDILFVISEAKKEGQ